MTDYRERCRLSVARWMRSVLEDKGWSANEWAKAAGTSATNITRMIGPGDSPMPTVETIIKLATIARSQPDLLISDAELEAPPSNLHPSFCPECGFDLREFTRRPPAAPRLRKV